MDEKVHSVGVIAPSHTLPSGICEAGYLTRKWLQFSCISLFNDLLLSLNFFLSSMEQSLRIAGFRC